MFYVSLQYANSQGVFTQPWDGKLCEYSRDILGNLDGQGFYNYKRLSTVIEKLQFHVKGAPKFRKQDLIFSIYSITESEKFKNFEETKKPVYVIRANYKEEKEHDKA